MLTPSIGARSRTSRAGTHGSDARSARGPRCICSIFCAPTPVLTGTLPLDIDVESSDLDIIGESHDLAAFEDAVKDAFGAR